MGVPKERLDVLLVQKGLFESREKAKAAIMAGLIHSPSERLDKAGMKIPIDTELRIKGEVLRYVSRGGLKLEHALHRYPIPMQDAVVADIGASTGGFTDCALQHGAQSVYAIDVGTNQLAWKLRQDPRVVNLEKTHCKTISPEILGDYVDVVTIDVAFISLEKVFPVAHSILRPDGHLVSLIKPQFEAGRDNVGKGGIVRDPSVHLAVLQRVISYAVDSQLYVHGLTISPITGMDGNIEFLGYFRPVPADEYVSSDDVLEALVREAHERKV